MSRGLTDPFEEEPNVPASNEDIMGVVLTLFMMVENLHQRLDVAGFAKVESAEEFLNGE